MTKTLVTSAAVYDPHAFRARAEEEAERTLDGYTMGWHDGIQAGRDQIMMEKRKTAATIILDGAVWTMVIILAISVAYWLGHGFAKNDDASRIEQALHKIELMQGCPTNK